MINNDWGMTAYPIVPGNEVVGQVVAIGQRVTTLHVGQTVGLGWFSGSCSVCRPCLGGDQNLCVAAEQTIVGRPGGFAQRVRAGHVGHSAARGHRPLEGGPVFCGGITVFNPLVQFDVRATHRVGVVGIGGLGDMALMFLRHWGCEVVAFTSPAKMDEALQLGAGRSVSSRDKSTFAELRGSFDFILVTATASLDWAAYVELLAPKGRLHFVGAVPEPISLAAFPLIGGQKSVSGSPLGSPLNTARMLDFIARHGISPLTADLPHVAGQRGDRALGRRQGALPRRAGKRSLIEPLEQIGQDLLLFRFVEHFVIKVRIERKVLSAVPALGNSSWLASTAATRSAVPCRISSGVRSSSGAARTRSPMRRISVPVRTGKRP